MKSFNLVFFVGTFLLLNLNSIAQEKTNPGPAEIHHDIKKLNFLGTALYLAAHPDDENTRLISYLDNEVMARTAYLSLTRGDGGQNLIGPEIRELLGVIRTQELLAARGVDGGEQMFTRANDFGYSKHPDETLAIWEDEKVMSDVVRAIRKFKPDVIINRFDANSAGRTHGHHTASAMLSLEAFDQAGNSTFFSDQLDELEVWQPKRLFFNTSWWFYGSREAFDDADKSKMLSVDVGVYYPWDGRSNTEIAAQSRSMHKCQGFGSTGTRGTQLEFLELLKGDMPSSEDGIFGDINTTWSRVKGGGPVGEKIERIAQNFNYEDPSASITELMETREMIAAIEDEYWRTQKLKEIDQIILDCSGLFLEAVCDEQFVHSGEELEVDLEMVNRSNASVVLKAVHFEPELKDTILNKVLENNLKVEFSKSFRLPELKLTAPYWLRERGSLGMYKVPDEDLIGLPETPHQLKVQFDLEIAGKAMSVTREIEYKFNSPEDGAVYRPLEVVPEVTMGFAEKVIIFSNEKEQDVQVKVRANKQGLKGELTMQLPKGWKCFPERMNVMIDEKGEEKSYSFRVTAPDAQGTAEASLRFQIRDEFYTQELITIDYKHIPYQSVLMPATAKLANVDVKCTVDKIGYIEGAGDAIPEAMPQMGCEVEYIDIKNEDPASLSRFKTIVVGIRAYNKLEELSYKNKDLMKYVENGGTVIVQYNTNRGLKVDEVGPFPLEISRSRVTVEEAEIRILDPNSPVLNTPNKISPKDFDEWVQERGLYFPDKWAPQYTAVLSSNDPGEEALDGGLLVAQYGEGWFVYTGYSWFRQLPAGVPGAYRIFANLISLGHE